MKLVVADRSPLALKAFVRAALPPGHELVEADGDEESLARAAEGADIILAAWFNVTAAVIRRASRLRLIQTLGAGYDNIDLEAARAAGVMVANTPGANAASVAEYTVMALLLLVKRFSEAEAATRRGEWPADAFMEAGVGELEGLRVGLLGFGAIGRATAQRLKAFGSEVRYFSRHQAEEEVERQTGAVYAPEDELLPWAEAVSAHLPLTAETRRHMDRATFAKMSRGVYFVNTGRGDLVDEAALREAITSGHVQGAVLDVLQEERTRPNPFRDLPNVLVTPHIAGPTRRSSQRILAMGMRNILRVLEGKEPENVVP